MAASGYTAVATASMVEGRSHPVLRRPGPVDGQDVWELARDTETLDLNSPYFYTLWCRDFASTTVLAEDAYGLCGFLLAYTKPSSPDTLFIVQAAVGSRQRGNRLAVRMLQRATANDYRYVECTVTPDNVASERFLTTFAAAREAAVERAPLFGAELFPHDHEPEDLVRIGPVPERTEACP